MCMDAFVFRAKMPELTYIIETNGCEEKRATETAEYFLKPFEYKAVHMHDKQNHNEATTRSKPNDFPILTLPNGVPILTEILTAQPFFLYLTSPCLNHTPRRHSRISNYNSHSDSHECTALRPQPNTHQTHPTKPRPSQPSQTYTHRHIYTPPRAPHITPHQRCPPSKWSVLCFLFSFTWYYNFTGGMPSGSPDLFVSTARTLSGSSASATTEWFTREFSGHSRW